MRYKNTYIGLASLILVLVGGLTNAQSVRQTAEMVDFATGAAERGGGVLTRTATEVSARLSTMDLDKKDAYSVWWVVFNEPGNCLVPYACGEPDIVSGMALNAEQIAAAQISVFYADGFVTGTDGTGNVTAHLAAGMLPEGTFVNFGWPLDGDPPSSGLTEENGLCAEIHMVVRTHGDAVAGSVGLQTSTFNGLCNVQTCEDQQAIVFPSPLQCDDDE